MFGVEIGVIPLRPTMTPEILLDSITFLQAADEPGLVERILSRVVVRVLSEFEPSFRNSAENWIPGKSFRFVPVNHELRDHRAREAC